MVPLSQPAHQLRCTQSDNNEVFWIFPDHFPRAMRRGGLTSRRATEPGKAEPLAAQFFQRLELGPSENRVDQRLRGKPDGFGRQSPQRCRYSELGPTPAT